MSTSEESSKSSSTASPKTCSSGLDGYESSDLEWKKTELPSASSTSLDSNAPSLVPSTSSSSDASSSALAAPLPGLATQQDQQLRPNDISEYGGTYVMNNAAQTFREYHTTN